jgi:hypothetical protein
MGEAEIGQRIDDGVDDDAERRGNAAFTAAANPNGWVVDGTSLIAVAKNGTSAALGIE